MGPVVIFWEGAVQPLLPLVTCVTMLEAARCPQSSNCRDHRRPQCADLQDVPDCGSQENLGASRGCAGGVEAGLQGSPSARDTGDMACVPHSCSQLPQAEVKNG